MTPPEMVTVWVMLAIACLAFAGLVLLLFWLVLVALNTRSAKVFICSITCAVSLAVVLLRITL